MYPIASVLLTVTLLAANSPVSRTAPAGKADHSADDKKIICYYSSWSGYRPAVGAFTIDDIPVHLCTHVIYAFIGLNNRTWELLVLDPNSDITKGGYRKFTSLKKKNPHLKTLISVGGWVEGGQKYSELVSRPERRKIFVNSVVDFLKWFNFDGLDLDWEFPGSLDRHGRVEDKDNFIQLVQELRHAFDKEGWGWSLTAVVPIMRFRVEGGYDVPKLASLVDHIHLLTYDLRGNWTGFTDVHAPLRARTFDQGDYQGVNVQDGTEYWIKAGAPPEKITVGLALYGRTYTLEDPATNGLHSRLNRKRTAGNPGPYTKANGTLAYYEICELFQSGGWERKYDDIGDSPYLVKGDQWIGYDDRNSLVRKVQFVQEKGYGGVAIWSVDLDDFRGVCGESRILLHAIYKQLTGRSPLGFVPTRLPESTEIDFLDLQTDSPQQVPSQTLNPFNGFTPQSPRPPPPPPPPSSSPTTLSPPSPSPTPGRFDFTGLQHQPGFTGLTNQPGFTGLVHQPAAITTAQLPTAATAGVHDQTHITLPTTTEEPRTTHIVTIPITEPPIEFDTTVMPVQSTQQNDIFVTDVTQHSTETPPTLSGVRPDETFVPFGDRDHFRTTVPPVSLSELTEPTFILHSSSPTTATSSLSSSSETIFTTAVTEPWTPEVTWDADLFQAITSQSDAPTTVAAIQDSNERKVETNNGSNEETIGRLAPQTKPIFEIQVAPKFARIPELPRNDHGTISTSQTLTSPSSPSSSSSSASSLSSTSPSSLWPSSLSTAATFASTTTRSSNTNELPPNEFQSVTGTTSVNHSDIELDDGPLAEVSAFDRIRTESPTELAEHSRPTTADYASADGSPPSTRAEVQVKVDMEVSTPRPLRSKVPLRRRKTNRRKLQRTTADITSTGTETKATPTVTTATTIRSTRVTNIRQRNRTDSQRSPRPGRPSRRFLRRKTTTTSSPDADNTSTTAVTVTEGDLNVTARQPLKRASNGTPSANAATTVFPAESEHFTSRKPLRKRLRTRTSLTKTPTTSLTTATTISKVERVEGTTPLPIAEETDDLSNVTVSLTSDSGIKKATIKPNSDDVNDEEDITSATTAKESMDMAVARSVEQEVQIQDHLSKNQFSYPTMTSEGDYTAQSGTVDEVFIKFAPPSTADDDSSSAGDDDGLPPVCSINTEAYYSHRKCNKYWWCIHGTATLKECARGLVWHQETHTCDWASKLDVRDKCH